MRARTRVGPAVAVGIALGVLTGCTPKDGRTYPNATDLARAQRIWADPWLAPSETTTVGPNGPAPGVRRDVAGRSYATPAAPRDVVASEVRAAQSVGWLLTSATCTADADGVPGSATVELAKGSGPDDSARVTVRASVTSRATKSAEVGITALVPHHLDSPWETPTAMPLETSCLVTGSPGPTTAPAPAGLPNTVVLSGDRHDPPRWSDAESTAPIPLVDELANDAGLRGLGISLTAPKPVEGSASRSAVLARSPGVADGGSLTSAVSTLMSRGWTLTYAGCLGPGAPHVAEVARPVGQRVAVVRLGSVEGSPVDATVALSTPGWSLSMPGAVTEPCFAQTPRPESFSHSGTPSLGPTRLVPVQRSSSS